MNKSAATLARRLGLIAAAIICTGCAKQQILDQARKLSDDVKVYRQAQAARIESLNKEYQAAFLENLDTLVRLNDAELTQSRDVDAQLLVDQITESDKATYVGAQRGRLAASTAAQRKAIDAADASIATARDNYLNSYHQAKLQLVKLDQLQSDLNSLAEQEDALRVAGAVIQKVAENYRQVQEEQKAGAKGNGAGNAAKP